jgi:hypothetical protein
MNKYNKPVFTEKDLGYNPTVNELVIPVVMLATSKMKEVDGIKVLEEVELEYTQYTKVFKTPQLRAYVNNLSDKAQRLYLWLMYEIETGKDYLWINRTRYMEESGIKSITTVTNALNELHRYAFIVPTIIKDVYWINPQLFFSGSRIKKYPSRLKIRN